MNVTAAVSTHVTR